MRQRAFASLALVAAMTASVPAIAHDHNMPMPQGMPQGMPMPPEGARGGWDRGGWDQQRDAWLAECRHRLSDNGVGGAVIGGLIGGVAGHEIAGRGDKVLGTVAGAAVGAVAGAAIDKAEDRGRNRDRCEAMLQGYGGQQQGYGYGYPAYGYGYAVPMMMVPVMMVQAPVAPKRECKEVVTTEYVTEYVTVPVRHRYIKPRPQYKRVPVTVPDKRVRMSPDKRVLGS